MELELKITCACHQAKISICCQTPLVAPIAPKFCTAGFFNMPNPNLPSDLLSDHSSNTIESLIYDHIYTMSIGLLTRYIFEVYLFLFR